MRGREAPHWIPTYVFLTRLKCYFALVAFTLTFHFLSLGRSSSRQPFRAHHCDDEYC